MNLVPFIMVIILTLGLFSLSQFESAIMKKRDTKIYLAYFKGLRNVRNDKIGTAYKKHKSKKEGGKKLLQAEKERKNSEKYFREKRLGWEKGRLNLSSLLKKPHEYPILEALAVEYVKQLYSHAHFFPKNDQVIKDLLKALIKERQNNPSISFDQVQLENPQLQNIFYKMNRGTHTYDLETRLGYPPFGDMFTFAISKDPPMNYHYANLSFLRAVFGKKITQDFVLLEKKKLIDAQKKWRSPIKLPEFKNFLSQYGLSNQNNLLELFNFSYQTSDQTIERYQDPATRITVIVR